MRTSGMLLLAAALATSACSDVDLRPLAGSGVGWHDDTFFQEREDQVDILLIVDDSCSMADEQDELGESFETFVDFIELAETDYHLGVTTTDVDGEGPGQPDRSGALRGEPPWITRDSPDAAEWFRDAVRVGLGGSSEERGLEAARRALGEQQLAGANRGFYRPDAALTLIFVSDEDDASPDTPASYLQHFGELKGGDEELVLAHGLIGLDPDTFEAGPCGPGDPYEGGATPAPRYESFIETTGGIDAPICTGNFAQMLWEMGRATTRIRDRFPLSAEPHEETVRVTLAIPGTPEYIVGGSEVAAEGFEDGTCAWRVERDTQGWWLQFMDLEGLPPADTRIRVEYRAVD